MLYHWGMAYKDPNDERAKAARRRHYENNKQKYKDNAAALRKKMQHYVWTQKRTPCMDCDVQYNPWVMQFDHRPEEEKVADISKLVRGGSWKKLVDEIAKCDVVCANCHIMRTATRGNWQQEMTFIYKAPV